MFRAKPDVLAVLSRDRLGLYAAKGQGVALTFPEGSIRYAEVLDKVALTKTLADFLTTQQLRGHRILLLLAPDLIFKKVIPLTKTLDIAAVQADFETKIPFDPENRHAIPLQLKDSLVLLGTNLALYGTVSQALQAAGNKIYAIAPDALFAMPKTKTLSPQMVTAILQDAPKAQAASFVFS